MKRYLLLGVAAVALAVPVAASAAQPPTAGSLAVQSCKAQQAALGAATFKSTYGANAYGKCVSKANHTASAQLQAASASCKAEQAMSDADFSAAHGGKTFAAYYGANSQSKGKGAGSNAFRQVRRTEGAGRLEREHADDGQRRQVVPRRPCGRQDDLRLDLRVRRERLRRVRLPEVKSEVGVRGASIRSRGGCTSAPGRRRPLARAGCPACVRAHCRCLPSSRPLPRWPEPVACGSRR